MDVSFIIINYNTFQITCRCVESVLRKTKDLEYEIILVDNASTEVDAREFLVRFPQIILVQSEVNDGFAKGNNRGIARAKGRFILLLNSDTLLQNNAARICMQFLEKDTRTAVVAARLENSDGTHQCNCQRFPSVWYGLLEFIRLQKIIPSDRAGKILFGHFFDHNSIAYPDWVWGTFFMFRKDLLKEFPGGLLHETYFMYVEDMQWCLEFRRKGYQIAFEPSALIVHLNGQSKGKKSQMMWENTALFMNNYYTPVHRFLIKLMNFMLVGKFAYY